MNIRLLRRVQRAILKEPRQFAMESWFDEQSNDPEFKDSNLPRTVPNCGTVACIGGWAIALQTKKNPRQAHYASRTNSTILMIAADYLGLKQRQAELLFLHELWPNPYKRMYSKYTRTKQWKRRGQVAVRRIEHFIKTDGEE